jgi:hypothetical protein
MVQRKVYFALEHRFGVAAKANWFAAADAGCFEVATFASANAQAAL